MTKTDRRHCKNQLQCDVPNPYHKTVTARLRPGVRIWVWNAHQYLGWGIQFLDVDNDGRKDIVMVNGHVYPEVDRSPLNYKYWQPRMLYWNAGGGKFKDLSNSAGPGISEPWASRGLAVADLANDGSIEVVINNLDSRPSLLKNFGTKKHWLTVRCVGTKSNRDAVGARVYVYVGDRRISGEIQTGASFLSQTILEYMSDLPTTPAFSELRCSGPAGNEVFPGGKANQIVVLTEGTGSPVAAAKPAASRP